MPKRWAHPYSLPKFNLNINQFIIFRCDIPRGEAEHARQSRSKASSSFTCFPDAEPPPKKGVPPPPKKGVCRASPQKVATTILIKRHNLPHDKKLDLLFHPRLLFKCQSYMKNEAKPLRKKTSLREPLPTWLISAPWSPRLNTAPQKLKCGAQISFWILKIFPMPDIENDCPCPN